MNSKSSMEILQETGKIAIKDNISNNSHKLDFENRICCGYERTWREKSAWQSQPIVL